MNLFVVAMKDELALDLSKYKEIKHLGYDFYKLDKKNLLVFSDVGKENALMCVSIALSKFKKIDTVFNLGTSGSVLNTMKCLDVVVASSAQFLDVDFSEFGYELNEIPRKGKVFNCDEFNTKIIKSVLALKNINSEIKPIATSDSFIHINNYKRFTEVENVSAFDMEAACLGFACKHYDKKFNSIKIISDNIYSKKSKSEFEENLKECSLELTKILFILIENF